jgi:hypothetical protein
MQHPMEATLSMSIEEWFDKYGVAILRREEKKRRMSKLLTDLRAKATAAGR